MKQGKKCCVPPTVAPVLWRGARERQVPTQPAVATKARTEQTPPTDAKAVSQRAQQAGM